MELGTKVAENTQDEMNKDDRDEEDYDEDEVICCSLLEVPWNLKTFECYRRY